MELTRGTYKVFRKRELKYRGSTPVGGFFIQLDWDLKPKRVSGLNVHLEEGDIQRGQRSLWDDNVGIVFADSGRYRSGEEEGIQYSFLSREKKTPGGEWLRIERMLKEIGKFKSKRVGKGGGPSTLAANGGAEAEGGSGLKKGGNANDQGDAKVRGRRNYANQAPPEGHLRRRVTRREGGRTQREKS